MDYCKKIVHLFLVFLLVPLISIPAQAAQQDVKPIRFGSVAMDIPSVMHKRLTPLTRYLSKTLKRPVILTLSPNMKAAIENVASGRVDLAYLTPVAYLRSKEKGNTQIIVKTITKGKASFQLMIVVRDDSKIMNESDVKGKTFAFGDKAALLQRAVVVGAGIPLDSLSKYSFLSHYDNIVRAVLNRDYDAGILKDTKAFKWENKGIRIVHRSPHLPPYNITARNKLDPALFKQIQQAFLNLRINNPEHKAVIKALSSKYTGFAKTDDSEYDIVRKLTKPFNK